MADRPEASGFGDFESLFADVFGMPKASPTHDLSMLLPVSLREAAHGAEREVELPRANVCVPCEGKGGAPDATWEECKSCDGAGVTRFAHGALSLQTTCQSCTGRAGRWSAVCAGCEGQGRTSAATRVRVRIPPGVADGTVLRLAGQGNDLGEGPGDALLTVAIAAHPVLRRDGDDLLARVYVEPERAAEGGEIEVPWLEGSARVKVPAGLDVDVEVRLAGWGCVRAGCEYAAPPRDDAPYRTASSRGDLVVTLTTQPITDPHQILGVTPGASLAELQAAYRALALAHHPDRRPGDAEAARRFQAITEAYAQLTSREDAMLERELARAQGPIPVRRDALILGALLLAVVLATVLALLR